MDSTFLRMLAVPSKTDFCKVPTLYDIPNFFKLHSKSLGMDPSAPIIIGTINVSLSHFLAISNGSSEQLYSFFVSFQNQVIIDRTRNINYQTFFRILFHNHNIWPPSIQTSHRIFTKSFSVTDSTYCSYHFSHTFTPYYLYKAQWMFKHILSCLLLYSFCANILQPLTM